MKYYLISDIRPARIDNGQAEVWDWESGKMVVDQDMFLPLTFAMNDAGDVLDIEEVDQKQFDAAVVAAMKRSKELQNAKGR